METPAHRPTLDLWGVLSESKRIIAAHSRHFLALSVIFLLPLSFSLIVCPTLQQLINDSFKSSRILLLSNFQHPHKEPIVQNYTLFFSLVYSLFVFVSSLCAVGTITYSVFNGFYGRPVKLISAVRSIFTSFFPLLVTAIASHIIVCSILILFGILLFLVIRGIELLEIRIDYSSPYFIGFSVVFLLALLFVLVYLQVNWTLAPVIVVVESNWGLEALRRSSSLIKGMKGVAFSSSIFFGFLAAILVWSSWVSAIGSSNNTWWKSWAFIVQIVATSATLLLLLLYNTASNSVLYMYIARLYMGSLLWKLLRSLPDIMLVCLSMMGRFLMLFQLSKCEDENEVSVLKKSLVRLAQRNFAYRIRGSCIPSMVCETSSWCNVQKEKV